MKNTIIILVVLVIIGIGAYFIFSNNNSSYQTPVNPSPSYTPPTSNNSNTNVSATTTQITPTTPVSTTPKTPTASSVTVSIKNFAFNPSIINIKVGTKVTWTNNDTAPHTVTSDSGSLLNSQTLSPGQSYSVTFTTSGSTSYHCSIHPMMHGTIIVTN
jgi:plastocyanin